MTKQQILLEIKRLAVANSGQAPGTHKFNRETGCRKHDWYGKHWLRWSDAIKEAGYKPNQMEEGYEEEFLIEKFLDLAKALGHLPIDSELRMKSLNEKDFPSPETFRKRLGRKTHSCPNSQNTAKARTSLRTFFDMCEIARLASVDKTEIDEESDSNQTIGIVYLIKSGKYYKIGKTKSLGRRVYDLAIQLAEKPTTVHVIKTDDPDGIEAYWHKRFAGKRKGGEWFDLNAADVKAFKKWIRIA